MKKMLDNMNTIPYNRLIKRKGDTHMREELLTKMIQRYGFEHKAVIRFAELMEQGATDEQLQAMADKYLKKRS